MKLARTFAGLIGMSSAKPAAEDDEKEKDGAARAEGDNEEKDAAARAEGEEEGGSAEAEDDDKDAARAEGDGDEDEDGKEKDAKKAARAARAAERARCCAIFAHGIKAGMPELAGTFAYDTNMSAAAAKGAINAAKKATGNRGGLSATMAALSIPNPGPDAGAGAGGAGASEAQKLIAEASAVYNQVTARA